MSTHPKDHTVQFKANSSPSPHPRLKDVSKRHFTLSWATLPVYVETSRWRYVRHLAVVVLVIGLMLATAGLITWEKRTRGSFFPLRRPLLFLVGRGAYI
jgi:hypothetical protein